MLQFLAARTLRMCAHGSAAVHTFHATLIERECVSRTARARRYLERCPVAEEPDTRCFKGDQC